MNFRLKLSSVVTAMFAVCGMNFWTFLASAILSLPLYLSLVFLGHFTEDQDERELHNYTYAKAGRAYSDMIFVCQTAPPLWRK